MTYPSDLTDKQWKRISSHFQRSDPRGVPEKHTKRQIVNGILYVVKGGVQWRMLPENMPPWQTLYYYFRKWSKQGLWEKILKTLNQSSRKKKGRKKQPSYGIIDSQSIATAYAAEQKGFDGGKKNQRT